jgi:hypothetical protein
MLADERCLQQAVQPVTPNESCGVGRRSLARPGPLVGRIFNRRIQIIARRAGSAARRWSSARIVSCSAFTRSPLSRAIHPPSSAILPAARRTSRRNCTGVTVMSCSIAVRSLSSGVHAPSANAYCSIDERRPLCRLPPQARSSRRQSSSGRRQRRLWARPAACRLENK